MPSRRLRLLFLFLTLLWAGVLYFLSEIPGTDDPPLFIHQDKLLHLIAFGLLGFMGMGATRAIGNTHRYWQIWFVATLVGLYGISDEYHQAFVPGRDVSSLDVVADIGGGILGAWAMYFLLKILSAKYPEQ